MTGTLFQNDVLQVFGHLAPTRVAYGEPAVTHRNDGTNQVVGNFKLPQTVSAGTAGDGAVDDTPLQRRVNVGKGNELRVGAHAGKQVA